MRDQHQIGVEQKEDMFAAPDDIEEFSMPQCAGKLPRRSSGSKSRAEQFRPRNRPPLKQLAQRTGDELDLRKFRHN
jgi:hypothetical protein